MASVIDELVATITLDATQFTKGAVTVEAALKRTQDASSRTAKAMQQDGAKAADFFSAIKIEALSLIGVLAGTGGLGAVVSNTAKGVADLGRAAKDIDVDPRQLAAFKNVIAQTGGSADAAQESLRAYTEEKQKALIGKGDPTFLAMQSLIGASPKDDSITAVKKAIDYAARHKNNIPMVNQVLSGLHFDQGLRDSIIQIGSSGNFQKMMSESMKDVPTEPMINNFTELQQSIERLKQALTGLQNHIIDDLSGPLSDFDKWLVEQIHHNEEWAAKIGFAGEAIGLLIGLRLIPWALRLKGISALMDAILATTLRLSVLSLPLFLSGDTNTSGDFDQDNGPWRQFILNHWPSWLGGRPELAAKDFDEIQSNFLRAVSQPESGGDYTVKNGGAHFQGFDKFPEGIYPGGTTTAAGRYQITSDTWREFAPKAGVHDFSPESQDRVAWYIANSEYLKKTGRDLHEDLKTGGHDLDIERALANRWPTILKNILNKNLAPQWDQTDKPKSLTKPPISLPPEVRLHPLPNNTNKTINLGNTTVNVSSNAQTMYGTGKDAARGWNDAMVTQANFGLA
jgi:muramidase (phage lysozyme)